MSSALINYECPQHAVAAQAAAAQEPRSPARTQHCGAARGSPTHAPYRWRRLPPRRAGSSRGCWARPAAHAAREAGEWPDMALAAATLRRYLLLLAQEHLEFRLPVSASRGQDWGWGRGVGPLRRRVGEALPSGAARGVPGRRRGLVAARPGRRGESRRLAGWGRPEPLPSPLCASPRSGRGLPLCPGRRGEVALRKQLPCCFQEPWGPGEVASKVPGAPSKKWELGGKKSRVYENLSKVLFW